MKIDIKSKVKWMVDAEGVWLMCQAVSPQDAKAICDGVKADKNYTLEIVRKKKKRSKNANDFLWEMCTQISEELAKEKIIVSKEEVYREHIKQAGKCEFVAVSEKAADSLIEAWNTHGIGWFAEKVDYCKIDGCVKVCLYYGSSTYDTVEMSRLLDSVLHLAESIGIFVGSPSEIALLKSEWDNGK